MTVTPAHSKVECLMCAAPRVPHLQALRLRAAGAGQPAMAQKVEVVLQPLYAPQAGRAGAVCSLLKIDDATFLLDCGWDERMGSEALEPLKKCVVSPAPRERWGAQAERDGVKRPACRAPLPACPSALPLPALDPDARDASRQRPCLRDSPQGLRCGRRCADLAR